MITLQYIIDSIKSLFGFKAQAVTKVEHVMETVKTAVADLGVVIQHNEELAAAHAHNIANSIKAQAQHAEEAVKANSAVKHLLTLLA